MILKNDGGEHLSGTEADSFINNIKSKVYKWHQFYNNEIFPNEFGFIRYMQQFKDNNKPKELNKTYYDIETFVNEFGDFTDPVEVDRPVNSIALYNNIANEAYIVCYITECDEQNHDYIKKEVLNVYKDACKEKKDYHIKNIKIHVLIMEDEKALIKKFFELVRSFSTLMLIGFNSSTFDDPFMFNRAEKLFGEHNRNNIVSEFGIVKKYGDKNFEVPDFLMVDILKLYKPVGQGGGGLGKPLPAYKLNDICKKELKLTKLDLAGGFRETYLHDIINYLAYNLLDTLLTFKLDQKLSFLEQTYELAKYNNATMGATITGRSFIYSYRNDLMYFKEDKLIRTKKFSKEVLYEPQIQDFG